MIEIFGTDYSVWFLLGTLITGIIAGFISALGGGRTLISFAFLTFMGLPVPTAVALGKFGSLGFAFGALPKFIRSKQVVRKYVLPLLVIATLGGYFGAKALTNTHQDLLAPFVALFLLCLLPLFFIKKSFGEIQRDIPRWQLVLGFIVYFFVAFFGGFFGAGSGVLIMYTLVFLLGLTVIQVKATNILPWFILNIVAVYVFAQEGLIDYVLGVLLFLGMLLGGYIGAHTAVKLGNRRVKYFFAIIVVLLAIKMLRPYIHILF